MATDPIPEVVQIQPRLPFYAECQQISGLQRVSFGVLDQPLERDLNWFSGMCR